MKPSVDFRYYELSDCDDVICAAGVSPIAAGCFDDNPLISHLLIVATAAKVPACEYRETESLVWKENGRVRKSESQASKEVFSWLW
jgi:hypothetical protein